MQLDDLPRVLANEMAAYDYPWNEGLLRSCLNTNNYSCGVLVHDDELVGHGIATAAVGEGHILNLCVHPDKQGQGLGQFLLTTFLDAAQERGVENVFLEVRASNRAALNLYLQAGFQEIGCRQDYYPASVGREDAVILGLYIPPLQA